MAASANGTAARRSASHQPHLRMEQPHCPMPDRPVPFLLTAEEAKNPRYAAQDFDWTLHIDPEIELRRRLERNCMIRGSLQRGITISYRSSGWSLFPRIHANDLCTFKPVTSSSDVVKGDIVFCLVQPGMNRLFGHIVWAKYVHKGKLWFDIGNWKGHLNGWCSMEHIYGKLIDVSRRM